MMSNKRQSSKKEENSSVVTWSGTTEMYATSRQNLSNTIDKTPLLQLPMIPLAMFSGGGIALRDNLVLLPIAISQYKLRNKQRDA